MNSCSYHLRLHPKSCLALESGFDMLHAEPMPAEFEGCMTIPEHVPDEELSDYALRQIAGRFEEPRELRMIVRRGA